MPHTGTQRGEPGGGKLDRVRASKEFQRHTERGQICVENIGIVGAALGSELMSQLAVFSEQLDDLT